MTSRSMSSLVPSTMGKGVLQSFFKLFLEGQFFQPAQRYIRRSRSTLVIRQKQLMNQEIGLRCLPVA